MADRRQVMRIGPGLVVAAAAGFLLGSCAGGDGSALTTATGTRPGLTGTRPERPTTTTIVTRPETTVVTTVGTETTSVTVLPPRTTTETTPTTTADETTSPSNTALGWIALGVALLAALLFGLLMWRHRRARAASWSSDLADLTRRSLVALDDVLAQGSVVTGHIQALAAEARSLERRAPDDSSRAGAAPLRARLDDLAGTLETDRTLRLGSPPPSSEQLSYSTALIRQQVEQLQGVLRPPSAGPSPA